MMGMIAFAIYSAALVTLAYQLGDSRGHARGIDEASRLIFGIPVVWP